MPQLFDSTFLKKLETLTLRAHALFRGDSRGERRSTQHGASVEFADFRPYVQGDDFRRIDWNAYAKFETLMLRLFVEEQELPVHILLDCSTSMNFGTPAAMHKFDYARKLAAAIGYIALANTDRVTITPVSVDNENGAEVLGSTSRPLRSKASVARLMEILENLKPNGRTDLNASLKRFALRTPRAGLCVLISDLLSDSGYEEGVKRLRYGKHDVTMVHVMSPQELNPELAGDVRLVDMETQNAVDITANRGTIQMYQKRLAAFLREAERFAHNTGSTYVLANTGVDFEHLVLRQFRALGLAG